MRLRTRCADGLLLGVGLAVTLALLTLAVAFATTFAATFDGTRGARDGRVFGPVGLVVLVLPALLLSLGDGPPIV